jgi:hypothetical protein
MGLGKFFKGIGGFFKKVFSKSTVAKIEKVLLQVEDILPEAFEVAKLVALATPTRIDDELIAFAESIAFDGIVDVSSKEDTLRSMARFLLQKKVRVKVADNVLNAALELAVAGVKAGKAELAKEGA